MPKSSTLWTALFSRLVVIAIQYLANILIPDHKPGVFVYPKQEQHPTIWDELIHNLFEGFLRWDGQYFMSIARYGYTYENSLAFFPLLPFMVRTLANVVHPFVPFLSLDSILLLSFVIINTGVFILATQALFDLSKLVLNEIEAYKVVVLFSYNPASIFFTAPYTECMFSYLSFKCMLNSILLYNNSGDVKSLKLKSLVFAVIPTALSTITRSNGVLNIGFLVYSLVSLFFKKLRSTVGFKKIIPLFISYSIMIIILVILCLSPFILFQYYCHRQFCSDFHVELDDAIIDYAKFENFILPGNFSHNRPTWCFGQVPLAYSYVQSHYWNVGFLKYYEFKQIPNFILAAPVIFIMMTGAVSYFRNGSHLSNLFNLDKVEKCREGFINPAMLVFVIHGSFLTVFCVFNVHIQVTTRMICSATPVFYWYLSKSLPVLNTNLFRELAHTKDYKSNGNLAVIVYFLSYFVIGIVMFCNDFPWT